MLHPAASGATALQPVCHSRHAVMWSASCKPDGTCKRFGSSRSVRLHYNFCLRPKRIKDILPLHFCAQYRYSYLAQSSFQLAAPADVAYTSTINLDYLKFHLNLTIRGKMALLTEEVILGRTQKDTILTNLLIYYHLCEIGVEELEWLDLFCSHVSNI
jgi:hypothetical protein